MLETSRERVALLKAGMDGKTIEKLYVILNNFELVGCAPQKLNCWEFVGCGRELGGENASESGVCMASIETSAYGMNGGKNGGRICWAVCGTFCGGRMDGSYAKKIISCRSCDFFNTVRQEEGNAFKIDKSYFRTSTTQMAEVFELKEQSFTIPSQTLLSDAQARNLR